MSSDSSSDAIDNSVMRELEDDGPLSHYELCDRMSIDWDELQRSIRRLRGNNNVSIMLDRRYTVADTDQK